MVCRRSRFRMASSDEGQTPAIAIREAIRACARRLWWFLELPRGSQRIPAVIAWAAGIASLVAIVQRFRLGADLTDDAFALAMPYRFALGDRAFYDEISIQQTAGIILYPFIWLFVKITHGSTYLVLYTRMVHIFVFKGVAALATYLAGRRVLKHKAAALAVAFVPFGFVPASIPNVGYNVIGYTLLTASTFLSFVGVSKTEPAYRVLACAGFLFAVTAFAYPPMLVAALLATPIVFVCAPCHRVKATGAFIAGALLLVVLLVPMVRVGGIAGIQRALHWGVHANQAYSVARLKAVVDTFVVQRPAYFGGCAIALTIAGITRSRALTAIVVPAVTLYLVSWNHEQVGQHMATLNEVAYLGAFAPAMVLVARPDASFARLSALVLLPSFAAATAGAFTSTQGAEAFCHGFHASLVFYALCGVRALERARVEGAFAFTPAFVISFSLVTRLWEYQYRDGPVPTLTERIPDGPYKGIYTTADHAHAFAEMSTIAKRFDRPPGRVLVLYESIGYYLWFRMKPGAHCVWEAPYGDMEGLLQYWEPRVTGQSIVIRVKGTGATAVDAQLMPPERLLLRTPHFEVFSDH